jgi:hypothetical protein
MSVSRANLIGGPAKVTWNSITMFAREDINVDFDQTWQDLLSSAHGVIDKVVTDRQIKVNMRLWGAWENISVLFPTTLLNPTVGTRIYGTSDLPLVVHKKTGSAEKITIHNTQITKLSNLYLGVDNPIFAADVEFTGLIINSGNPEDANSYYTIASSAYSDTTFAKTNFSQQRYSAAWLDNAASPAAITGFSAFQAHKGWNISWDLGLQDEYNANVGCVDKIITGFNATATCIPLEPTLAQIEAAQLFQGTGRALGSLLSGIRAGTSRGALTITGAAIDSGGVAPAISFLRAGISKIKPVFGASPLLNGEVTWMTTRGITSGTAGALATAA